MKLTRQELEMLAEFVCGRVDSLREIMLSPTLPESSQREIDKALVELDSLNTKLRPYHKE